MTNTITNLLLLLISTILPITSSTLTSTIILPLSHFTKHSPPLNIYTHLNHLATTSLSRARHLKNPAPTTATTSLSPHSYGGYSISLDFGTPPQTLPFVMDTGSSFVWSPCTHDYVCDKCNFSSNRIMSHKISAFIPKLSSSVSIVGCLNPKCGWVHDLKSESLCTECSSPNSRNCTQACPPYLIIYGSGTTGGLALLDTLTLNNEKVPGFLVGCSLFSSAQPAGIAGFGRGDSSVPSQLGLTKFSYCSMSHIFDDRNVSSSLNLTGKAKSVERRDGVTYTPLLKNPEIESNKRFSEYYYLGLNEIFVGGKKVKYNRDIIGPPDHVTGLGGTIIDSGTTFTYMSREIYEPLVNEMDEQVTEYKRAEEVESMTGLLPCFNVTGLEMVTFPSLKFHFKGGAKMEFPLENYFSFVGKVDVVCMTIVTDLPGQEMVSGPAVIVGNYQQQNFYVEYDLKHNKFGFKRQKCG